MAEMQDLQTLINARADARLRADLDATYPVCKTKFDYVARDEATAITLGETSIWLSWSGGLMSLIHEQLREQFRDQYRAEESANFLSEVAAMKARFEELTGAELGTEPDSE